MPDPTSCLALSNSVSLDPRSCLTNRWSVKVNRNFGPKLLSFWPWGPKLLSFYYSAGEIWGLELLNIELLNYTDLLYGGTEDGESGTNPRTPRDVSPEGDTPDP